MPPIQAEFNEYADISAALAADRGGFPVVAAVVGVGTGGVGIGSERVAELHVVHHGGEDSGLIPGQPIQPVGELLVGEAAQPRLVGEWTSLYGSSPKPSTGRADGAWFDRLVVMTVLRCFRIMGLGPSPVFLAPRRPAWFKENQAFIVLYSHRSAIAMNWEDKHPPTQG